MNTKKLQKRMALVSIAAALLLAPATALAQGTGGVSERPGGARMGGSHGSSADRIERDQIDRERQMQGDMNRAAAEARREHQTQRADN